MEDCAVPSTWFGRLQARAEEWIYALNERNHWLFRVYDWGNEFWAWLVFRGVRRRASGLDTMFEAKDDVARIRFLTEADFEEFAALLASFDFKYLPPHPLDASAVARALRRRSYLPFGVFYREKLVAYLLVRLFFPRRAVTGIWTTPSVYDRGFSQAALYVTAGFTRREGLADYATISIDNPHSVRMAQWAGWRIIRTNRRFHVLLRQ